MNPRRNHTKPHEIKSINREMKKNKRKIKEKRQKPLYLSRQKYSGIHMRI